MLQLTGGTHDHHSHPHQSLHLCPCRRVGWRYWGGLALLQVVRLHCAAPVAAWKWLRAPCPERGCPWDGPEGPGELVSDWKPKSRDSSRRTCGGNTGTFKELNWLIEHISSL